MSSSPSNKKAYFAIGIAAVTMVVLLILYGDVENPKHVSQNRLKELKQEVISFMETNKRIPTDLSELGLPEEMLQDHLGEPFKYIVDEHSITLLSYGSDKEPGGSFFKRDISTTIELPQ